MYGAASDRFPAVEVAVEHRRRIGDSGAEIGAQGSRRRETECGVFRCPGGASYAVRRRTCTSSKKTRPQTSSELRRRSRPGHATADVDAGTALADSLFLASPRRRRRRCGPPSRSSGDGLGPWVQREPMAQTPRRYDSCSSSGMRARESSTSSRTMALSSCSLNVSKPGRRRRASSTTREEAASRTDSLIAPFASLRSDLAAAREPSARTPRT
jgi:hypothetical protein